MISYIKDAVNKKGSHLELKIEIEEVDKWLALIYELSNVATLEHAITVAKFMAKKAEDKDIVSTVAQLYRAQCSGKLIPPISLKLLYEEMVKNIVEGK